MAIYRNFGVKPEDGAMLESSISKKNYERSLDTKSESIFPRFKLPKSHQVEKRSNSI